MGLQGVADGLGRDTRVGERGLELGVGLGPGLDEAVDVPGDGRAAMLGPLATAEVVGIEATDTGAEFVEAGLDGITPPTEDLLGATSGAVTILEGHLGLEPPPPMAGEQPGGGLQAGDQVICEWLHNRLLGETSLLPRNATTRGDHFRAVALVNDDR